ncbi:GDSL esterase/lipase At5g14450 [Vitis riparia]|uniref:GDSL esterase/lipase At5g14450 n=1 Tax=Vitis riparia TaxID=96939 RepID=UPI00155A3175|nr:GDSL esterase/lipase At5g14450 [Vitis riparia]
MRSEMWMKMESFRALLGGILVAWVLGVGGEVGMGLPSCGFPAIYNFGDSNSDTGGISAAFLPISAPYGENFFHKPAGRDSDGRVLIDFIAEHLGLPYLSAYLDSIGANFRHGANFATGGSTILRPNETIYQYGISPFFLDMQISQFDQFKARTRDLYIQAKSPSDRDKLPRPEDFPKALYTFDIGQNDLSVGFRQSYGQLRASIPDIVNKFTAAVQHLYQEGARTFWIHNTGPIGCLPVAVMYIRNPPPGMLDQYGCNKAQNEIAVEFNKQLKDGVMRLRAQLPQASITYVDLYAAKYGLISDAKGQGFVDPLKICCGNRVNDYNVWCGQKAIINGTEVYGSSCASPSAYISWDGVHYSQAANHWFANHILNGSLSDSSLPIAQACHKP